MVGTVRTGQRDVGSVGGVADDRMSDGGELAADLVCDARVNCHLQNGVAVVEGNGPVKRFGEHRAFTLGKGGAGDAAHASAE